MSCIYIVLLSVVTRVVTSEIFDANYLDGNSSPEKCDLSRLAIYRMSLNTFWTEENFPKSYPKFRPPAHWSVVFGQSHNAGYRFFSLGTPSSSGLRRFAERGDLRGLAISEKDEGIFDQFTAEGINEGKGHTHQEIFVDGNHSLVSVVCRMVPSPDWFVGVDSVDLCSEGEWVDNLTIALDPLDAGTDGGLTFTSPRWRLQKPLGVYQHTSTFPDHRAASFFYPRLRKLPSIAKIEFIKLREHDFDETVEESIDEGTIPETNGTLDLESANVIPAPLENGTQNGDTEDRNFATNSEREPISNTTEEILTRIKNSFKINENYFPKIYRQRLSALLPKEKPKTVAVSSNLLRSFISIKKTNSSSSSSSYFSW